MFFISISNGLLEKEHRKRMGLAVWEFMWCLDKITKVDDQGIGWVLGGKPINLNEIAEQLGIHRVTVSRGLTLLEKQGYIKKQLTPYGIRLYVFKAKKRFNKSAKPEAERISESVKPSLTETLNPVSENAKPNKTVSVDSTVRHTEHSSEDIVKVINLFKETNPNFTRWYGRQPFRLAIDRLISLQGMEKLERVIALLPKTNKIPFLPTITTPIQLEEKWASLEAGLIKEKSRKLQTLKPVFL